jgi:general secretion pathway protein D
MSLRLILGYTRTLVLATFVCTISLMGNPIISVDPSTPDPTVGQNFTVAVDISNVTDLYAFQFDLGFDPNIVEVDSVTEGPFLTGGGSTFFVPGTIDNVGGSVSDNADTLLTAISGVSGSGTLAVFDLTALAPGSSSLSAFNTIFLDSSLSEIDTTVQAGSVTVPGSVVPEPRYGGLLICGGLMMLVCLPRRGLAKLALRLVPTVCAGQSFDTTPPSLVGFSFSPSAVNVTSGPQNVTVSLHVTDDLSGVLSSDALVYVTFQSPSGNQNQTTYLSSLAGSTSLNAQFQGVITIPEFSESGNWTVSDVFLRDAVGNSVNLNATTLASMFFPTILAVTSVPDTTPPTLTSLSIVPSSINVSHGPQAVTLSLGLTDAQSGVALPCISSCLFYSVTLTGPSGDQFLGEAYFNFRRISGTDNAGVWSTTVTFPQYAEAGLWTLTSLAYQDNAGNQAYLNSTEQIRSLGFPVSVNVTSTPSDNVPPVLTGFGISPLAMDTSTGPQTITLTLGLTDNLSGVDFTSGSMSPNFNQTTIEFTSPSGQQTAYVTANPFTLNAGTPLNGQWQASIVLPQYSEGGTWTLQFFQLQDTALNELRLSAGQLQTEDFPTSFIVYKPSLQPDGSVGPSGGMVEDTVFGTRASLSFPAGELSSTTTVSIDVLSSPLSVPTPAGFSINAATFFTNIQLVPEPSFPLPAPGLTLTLPLMTPLGAGTVLSLYRLDPLTGLPIPAQNVSGANIQGFVDSTGLSATFMGISRLSTAVAYRPLPGTVLGDVNEDGKVNCTDMAIVKADFGEKIGQPGYNSHADVNQDGVINILDLAIVARQLQPGLTCQ